MPDSRSDHVLEAAIGEVLPNRCVIIVFDPLAEAGDQAFYSNASAWQLTEVLSAALKQLASGSLRMPVAGGLRWVDPDAEVRTPRLAP